MASSKEAICYCCGLRIAETGAGLFGRETLFHQRRFECGNIKTVAISNHHAAIVVVGIHHSHTGNGFALGNQPVSIRFTLYTGYMNQHLWHINL